MVVHVGGRGPGHIVRVQGGFSLSSLFNGASGFDFTDLDPSKTWGADSLGLLYTSTNAVPLAVTTSGNAVGTALDKSAALVLGAEQAVNGGFSSDTSWTKGSGWTISGGALNSTGSAATAQTSQESLTAGSDIYLTQYDVTAYTQGNAGLFVGDSATGTLRSAVGTYTQMIRRLPAGDATLGLVGTSNLIASMDNVSAKAVTGNHASQTTSASRPVYTVSGATKYLVFDGTDDCLLTTLNPAASTTVAVCCRVSTGAASQFVVGVSDGAGANRCFLGVNNSNKFIGGWGADAGLGGTQAIDGQDVVLLLRANATTVQLWLNGQLHYTGAANGAATTSSPFALGARNRAGTQDVFLNGRIYGAVAVQSYIADADVVPLMRQLGALAGLSF